MSWLHKIPQFSMGKTSLVHLCDWRLWALWNGGGDRVQVGCVDQQGNFGTTKGLDQGLGEG